LPPEKQSAATEKPKPKTKPQSRPAQDEDGFDIVAPMIFGF
jgi:hypothetical protein